MGLVAVKVPEESWRVAWERRVDLMALSIVARDIFVEVEEQWQWI